jgi:hypothetical protein
MLHIRVVTTPDLTGRLLDRLADLPGIRNLIVLEGVTVEQVDASLASTTGAATAIGLSVAFGSWHEAGGSALQLLLNVVLLIVVGAGGLSAQRALWARRYLRKRPG